MDEDKVIAGRERSKTVSGVLTKLDELNDAIAAAEEEGIFIEIGFLRPAPEDLEEMGWAGHMPKRALYFYGATRRTRVLPAL